MREIINVKRGVVGRGLAKCNHTHRHTPEGRWSSSSPWSSTSTRDQVVMVTDLQAD